jgi:signal transduction histidine kinase
MGGGQVVSAEYVMTTDSHLNQVRRIIIFGTATFSAVLAVLLGLYIWHDYDRTMREASARLLDEARSLAEQAESTLRASNVVLTATRRIIAERGGLQKMSEEDLHRIFVSQGDLVSQEMQGVAKHVLFVLGSNGLVKATSLEYPTKIAYAADRQYFRYFLKNVDNGVQVSPLSLSRITGLPVVFLSIGLWEADGRFSGVLSSSLRLQYFEQFYNRRNLQDGQTIVVQRQDGSPIFRYPMSDSFIRSKVGDENPDFKKMLTMREGNLHTISPFDGKDRLIGFQATTQYPLLAIASQPKDSVLAQWRANAELAAAFLLATLSALALLARFSLRQVATAIGAEAASLSRNQCLTTMSQEIHGPVTAIADLCHVALETERDPKQQDWLVKMASLATSALDSVNNVMELGKIENGDAASHRVSSREPCDIECSQPAMVDNGVDGRDTTAL